MPAKHIDSRSQSRSLQHSNPPRGLDGERGSGSGKAAPLAPAPMEERDAVTSGVHSTETWSGAYLPQVVIECDYSPTRSHDLRSSRASYLRRDRGKDQQGSLRPLSSKSVLDASSGACVGWQLELELTVVVGPFVDREAVNAPTIEEERAGSRSEPHPCGERGSPARFAQLLEEFIQLHGPMQTRCRARAGKNVDPHVAMTSGGMPA